MSLKRSLGGFISKIVRGAIQALYSRKNSWVGRIFKSIVGFFVGRFQKKHGFMEDEIIDADIGFDPDELEAYQFPNGRPEQN